EKLWNGNQEHIRGLFTRDSVFLWASRSYRRRRRQYPIRLSRAENSHLAVVSLRSPREATRFLSNLGEPGALTNGSWLTRTIQSSYESRCVKKTSVNSSKSYNE